MKYQVDSDILSFFNNDRVGLIQAIKQLIEVNSHHFVIDKSTESITIIEEKLVNNKNEEIEISIIRYPEPEWYLIQTNYNVQLNNNTPKITIEV